MGQVLVIASGAIMFEEPTTFWNKIGFAVVVIASTRYSMLSVAERNKGGSKSDPVEPGGAKGIIGGGGGSSLPLLPK